MNRSRPYRMGKRARAQEDTRQRIVEAAVELHEEIGPRATTISAIAERAGVQRLTVYRHFPDDNAVYQACTSHWSRLNPPPQPADWTSKGDARARVAAALAAYCRYYRSTGGMWERTLRDAPDVPALRKPVADYDAYVAQTAASLTRPLAGRGATRRKLTATLTHALAFTTWRDLEAQKLDDRAKVKLMMEWVAGVLG